MKRNSRNKNRRPQTSKKGRDKTRLDKALNIKKEKS